MVNRITSTYINSSLVRDMQTAYGNYAKLTQQLSSGKKINSMLDNPTQSIHIVESNRQLNRIDTWSANIDYLTNEIKETSDTIDYLIDKGQRAKDLATFAANETSGGNNLQTTLDEVNQIIDTIVSMANNKYNGNYIFSGTNTKTPPYTIQYDEAGEIQGIKYNGTKSDGDWERKLEIADGVFQTVNITGIEVFGEADINGNRNGVMGDLIELRNTLSDMIKNEDSDYNKLSGMIDKFTNSLEKMAAVNSRFGTTSNKLEISKESLNNSRNNLKEYVSGIQEVDITQAVSDWHSSQYAYQASMQVFSAFNSISLLDYM